MGFYMWPWAILVSGARHSLKSQGLGPRVVLQQLLVLSGAQHMGGLCSQYRKPSAFLSTSYIAGILVAPLA